MALEITHDWDGVLATFDHPRYELLGPGTIFDGEAAVRSYFASSREPFPDQANEIIAIAADADTDTVLVEFWLTGTHLGPLRLGLRTIEPTGRSEEHTSELQSLMRNSYAVLFLQKQP